MINKTPLQMALLGRHEKANYKKQLIKAYGGNPLIEALPPIFKLEEVYNLLKNYPDINDEERTFDPEVRLHCVQQLVDYVEPMLPFFEIERRFSRMIRHGLVTRNPLLPTYARQFQIGFETILKNPSKSGKSNLAGIRSTAAGFAIPGISGVGKTTAIEQTLLMYPQVVQHTKFNNKPFILQQIVWLKLNCPFDGSVKGLCINFFQAVDAVLGTTSYFDQYASNKNATVDILIPNMARVASLHCLGVLVIDEFQNLNEAASGGDKKMLNFITQLVNTLGVPVTLIGTFRALGLFKNAFSPGRRMTNQGDLVWDRMSPDEEWDHFLEKMWRYQWTSHPTILSGPLNKKMYKLSQGITDIAVKLYMLAQWKVIADSIMQDDVGTERITTKVLQDVFDENMRIIRPMIQALERGDKEALEQMEDLVPRWSDLDDYLKRTIQKVKIHGELKATVLSDNVKQSDEIRHLELLKTAMGMGVSEEDAQKITDHVLRNNSAGESIHELRREVAKCIIEGIAKFEEAG